MSKKMKREEENQNGNGNGKVKLAEIEGRVTTLEEKVTKTEGNMEATFELFRKEFIGYTSKVGDLSKQIELMNQRLSDTVSPILQNHQKTLFGNPEDMGRGGVCGTITKIEDDFEPLKKEIADSKLALEGLDKKFWGIILLILTILVGYFFTSGGNKKSVEPTRAEASVTK